MRRNRWGQRLIALGGLGFLVFNYPILGMFNSDLAIGGVPLLYAYLFVAWAVLIGLLAFVVERG